MIKKVENTVQQAHVISNLKDKEIVGTFFGNIKEFRGEMVIKRKSEKLYVNWKD